LIFFLTDLELSHETIRCKWQNQGGWILSSSIYFCQFTKFDTTIKCRTITTLATPHLAGKSGNDVEGMYIGSGVYNYLPKNIKEFFPNLTAFWVYKIGLKQVLPSDVQPFPNLREFRIEFCDLEAIEPKLFANNLELKYVSFKGNKIKTVAHDLFSTLASNIYINMDRNVCINSVSTYLADVKANVFNNCPDKTQSLVDSCYV
jgi:hypothetical protein